MSNKPSSKVSRTGNAIRNSGATLAYRALHVIFQFVLRTVFIRYLGNEYTGIAGLFTDILHVLSLMELGMSTAMLYALYKPLAEDNVKRVSVLMDFYKRVYTIIGCLVLIVGFACIPFLKYIVKDVPNIKEDIRLIFAVYVASTASSYFFVYRASLLRADQKARIISLVDIIVRLSESVIEIILIVILKNYFAYLFVYFIFTVIRNIILTIIANKRYSRFFVKVKNNDEKVDTKKMFKDVFALGVYKISGVVINSTDSIFISAFVGTVDVAIIGNFTLIINSLRTITSQIVEAVKPSIGNLAATSSNNKQEETFGRMNFISFWVSCFCCTCLFSLLNPFVGEVWFNESYKVSFGIISVLVVNFFIAVMVFPVESFRTANGLFIQGWARPAIMAVLNIVLDFFMGKQWGILGIFLATTISRLATQVWFDAYLVYKSVFKTSVRKYYLDYIVYLGLTVISCIISWQLGKLVPMSNVYASFIIKMIIAVIIPNVLVFIAYRKSENFSYIIAMGHKLGNKILKHT